MLDHLFMLSPLNILQTNWGHQSFRGRQEEIINAVLQNKDALALLPTGGGKSICYQVPALMKEGLCLVISPLIALMKDQVANLEKRDIPALALYTGQTFFEVKKILQNAVHGNFKFLYVSPERLESKLFQEYLPALNINLIAVDEAHCISQWGYDFRPSYLRIVSLRETVNAPILAVTASATSVVLDDIKDKLRLKDVITFRQSFKRGNLSYSAFNVDSKINKAIDILKNVPGSSIVYCKSRKLTKQVAQLLNLQDLHADYYHAGLKGEERSFKQHAWLNNQTRIMVCTNAFGMGIDKPDVRTVIHYNIPECIESYYQEAGRAGRDEKKSYAVLLYDTEDEAALKNLPDIRFPAIAEIKKIYQALADYLQIPVGIGEGNYYDFDLSEFIKNFQLDVFRVMNALKMLEQEGYFTFNETVFLPSQACFKAPKELLNEIEKTHAVFETIIKCLLRTYEGIYDNKVSINEKRISKLLKKLPDEIKQSLQQLQALGIIEYEPQKETPQLYFLTNRAPAAYLNVDHERYWQRKKEFVKRTELMLRFIQTKNFCRSCFISNYFGDETIINCGNCDNCLNKKGIDISEDEFISIREHILTAVISSNIMMHDFLQVSKQIKKEKLWHVLEYLQSEKVICIEADGRIFKLDNG